MSFIKNDAGIDGVSTLELGRGTYQIAPSGELLDMMTSPEAVLSNAERAEVCIYEITDSTGRRVLEVGKRVPEETPDGISIQSSPRDLLLGPPDDDPVMAIEIDTLPTTSFTFRDLTTSETLATARQSMYVLGKWQLKDASGTHRATLRRANLRTLLPWVRYGSYDLQTVDGARAARYDHQRVDRDSEFKIPPSRLEIEVASSPVPTELVLAFAQTVFRQAHGSGSSSGGAGAGAE